MAAQTLSSTDSSNCLDSRIILDLDGSQIFPNPCVGVSLQWTFSFLEKFPWVSIFHSPKQYSVPLVFFPLCKSMYFFSQNWIRLNCNLRRRIMTNLLNITNTLQNFLASYPNFWSAVITNQGWICYHPTKIIIIIIIICHGNQLQSWVKFFPGLPSLESFQL